MTNPIWHSGSEHDEDKQVMEFLAGEDVILDQALFPFDVLATQAHVNGLARIGVLSDDDASQLVQWLDELAEQFRLGDFVLDARFEDGHSAIEYFLSQRSSSLGGKVHTGRSRNDQVQVAVRLYLKHSLAEMQTQTAEIAQACLKRASQDKDVAMPGYTHLQPAVPSSVGMWMAGFAEAFTDDLEFAVATAKALDCNPLGTAAGYGVNLPLDRDGVSTELGFSRTQINPVNVQNSRGKFEVMALQVAGHVLRDVQRLAWDLSLFASAEFGFVNLPEKFTTGSSIMPNKKNPDLVELLRARVAVVDAAVHEIQSILSLPSGYHRDLQFTKAPLLRGISATLQALSIVPGLISGMKFDKTRMSDALTADAFATDITVELAVDGVPFREAYRRTKQQIDQIEKGDPQASLARRVSPGAHADLQLEVIGERLQKLLLKNNQQKG
ncbi:MAG TPA: argininosuccinate lyase [Xanthomonadales bacterium]|nr:argininosuccinate lyase [Xanthomonadales bacterium]